MPKHSPQRSTRSTLSVIDGGLYANRLIAAMEEGTVQALAPYFQPVDLQTGQVLYEAGDRVAEAYFPLSCVVSLVAVLANGDSAEVCIFGREGVVCYASSRTSRRAFGRYVVQIGGTALKLKLSVLDRVAQASPKLRELLRSYVEALLLQTFQTVACNACHPVEARCCRWILSTDDRVKGGELPLTHEFLSEMLGVQRSTVSIVMKSLSASGLVVQQRGVIKVVDRTRLRNATCECYDVIRGHFERLLPKTFSEP